MNIEFGLFIVICFSICWRLNSYKSVQFHSIDATDKMNAGIYPCGWLWNINLHIYILRRCHALCHIKRDAFMVHDFPMQKWKHWKFWVLSYFVCKAIRDGAINRFCLLTVIFSLTIIDIVLFLLLTIIVKKQ